MRFKKSRPGPPDFYVSVVNARESVLPTEPELEYLLGQTPFHPWASDDTNLYQKARKGIRNVILAVVDNGVISFINFSDSAFGLNPLTGRKKSVRPIAGYPHGGTRGRGRGRR
jgi:tRNA-splicing endonuclease subunit Sen54